MMAANSDHQSSLCNQQTINDSSNSSMYTQQEDSSSEQNDKLSDLNERNLAMSSLSATTAANYVGSTMQTRIEPSSLIKDHHLDMNPYQVAQDINQQVVQDYMMQNYLYNDYKSFADDTKSMTSIMTSVSTRKTFDFLSKVLPVLVFLLIVFLMIHFILYVRDIEPLNKLTEIICIALACVVFTLSSAFIVKIFCDSKHAGEQWLNPTYPEDYLNSRNYNNSYVYSNGLLLEPTIDRSAMIAQQPVISQAPQTNLKKASLINMKTTTNETIDPNKPLHYYVDAIGNRIYATQLANLDKTKRYTQISPIHQTTINNQSTNGQQSPQLTITQQPIQQPFIQQQTHRRNSSFSQRNFNLNGDKKDNLIKETST